MKNIYDKQKEFQQLINTPTHFITQYDKVKACNIQIRRAIDELHEALREMPYDLSGYGKSKKILSYHNESTISEIVDAQLFIINALNILGVNHDEFYDALVVKQEKNILRFKNKTRFSEKRDNFLIIIEGVDGIGKSEICEIISKRTGFPIVRMPDTKGDIEAFSHFYRRTVMNFNQPLILDRFYLSSIVYGQYFGRSVLLDDIHKIHEDRNVFMFVIDSEKPYRSDSFINEQQWPELKKIYLEQAKLNKWKVITNNTTLNNCVEKILEELRF
jgi:hypothetical protein